MRRDRSLPSLRYRVSRGTAADAEQIETFLADLERQGKSPHTVRNYRADLLAFGRWFDGANHEDFAAELITPTDVREYR